jgi:phosphoribosylformylglycinamidine synthase PurS subunit
LTETTSQDLVLGPQAGHSLFWVEGLSGRKGGVMKAHIKVTLKSGVLDPQGKAIQNALAALGFSGVNDVRQGKYIEVDLAETDETTSRQQVERMCRELLANTVIETYTYEIRP